LQLIQIQIVPVGAFGEKPHSVRASAAFAKLGDDETRPNKVRSFVGPFTHPRPFGRIVPANISLRFHGLPGKSRRPGWQGPPQAACLGSVNHCPYLLSKGVPIGAPKGAFCPVILVLNRARALAGGYTCTLTRAWPGISA